MNEGISVVIPFYKAGLYASDLVSSIAKQSYKPDQIIVVDDGNGDCIDLLRAAFKFHYLDFELYQTKGRVGPALARNLGLSHVKFRYVSFLDSDDIWDARLLQSNLDLIKEFKSVAVSSSCYFFNDTGVLNFSQLPNSLVYANFLQTNPVQPSMVLFDLSIAKSFFFENKGHEDLRLWLLLSRSYGEFICTQNYYVGIRRSVGSVSSNKFKAAYWHWKLLSDLTELSIAKRLILFIFYIFNALAKRYIHIYQPFFIPKSLFDLIIFRENS